MGTSISRDIKLCYLDCNHEKELFIGQMVRHCLLFTRRVLTLSPSKPFKIMQTSELCLSDLMRHKFIYVLKVILPWRMADFQILLTSAPCLTSPNIHKICINILSCKYEFDGIFKESFGCSNLDTKDEGSFSFTFSINKNVSKHEDYLT